MLHRVRSIERPRPAPEPSYMSAEQATKYLNGITSYRSPRPQGARPLPPWMNRRPRPANDSATGAEHEHQPGSNRSATSASSHTPQPASNASMTALPIIISEPAYAKENDTQPASTSDPINAEQDKTNQRQVSAATTLRPRRTISGATLVKFDPETDVHYQERGDRWMERQEAASIRQAMADMDIAEEQRIHQSAQDEASELVWRHQNPDAPYRNVDRRVSYREHLRKGSRTASRMSSGIVPSGTYTIRETAGGGNDGDGDTLAQGANKGIRSGSSGSRLSRASEPNLGSLNARDAAPAPRKPGSIGFQLPKRGASRGEESTAIDDIIKGSRRSSKGNSRRVSSGKSLFKNPEDKIYEEPDTTALTAGQSKNSTAEAQTAPPPLRQRRNPFARAQREREVMKASDPTSVPPKQPLARVDIHRNPPSQSRNPEYTSNAAAANPSAAEAIDATTDPAAADVEAEDSIVKTKDGLEVRSDDIRSATSRKRSDRSPNLPSPTFVSDKPGRPIVSFKKSWQPTTVEMKQETSTHNAQQPNVYKTPNGSSASVVPTLDLSVPPVPVINIDDGSSRPSPVVNHACTPIPSINVHESAQPSIPSINVEGDTQPTGIPTISIACDPNPPAQSQPQTQRPLPEPSHSTPSKPNPQPRPRPNWLPRSNTTASTALCAQCGLPISGRILSAAGSRFHPACFRCHHCAEHLECVAFYPEPEPARSARISRIRRRLAGESIPDEPPTQTAEHDGFDEDHQRFYCHLDFHELFSPRCKSCKTPIEGEVVVACGAEWHVGHFFCAECGDPFDSSTPFVEKEGFAWCVDCHTRRYSTKCKKCRRPVVDTVVRALEAEWHVECFCCAECGDQFDDGRYFLRPQSQDPVCVKCEERRLKA